MNAIYFAALCLIWGTTWMAIKINLSSFPPFYSAGLRFLLAAAVLFIVMKIRGASLPKDIRESLPSVVFGVLNGISYGLVYWGEQFISSGLTAILNASLPFFSIIFAYFLIGEKLTLQKTVGTIVGFIGVLLLFYQGLGDLHSTRTAGQLAIVGASAVYALAGVHVKKRSTIKPLVAVTIQMFFAALVILAVAVPAEYGHSFRFAWAGIFAFLYLSLVGSALAFYLYNTLILRIEVTKLGYISMVTPAVAAVIGAVMLRERMQWQSVLGLLIILTGMAIINLKVSRPGLQLKEASVECGKRT